MADPVKILVVDPNVGALTALRDSLSFAADLEFVGDAGLGPVALTWARTLQPDVIVVASYVTFADEQLPLVLPVPDLRETSLNPASIRARTRNIDYW